MAATDSMEGRVCLVTGASSGIGREAAAALAGMGATIVMTARERRKGEAAVTDVKARSGNNRVELLIADFGSQQSVRRMASEFRSRHARLHVLVNNAGAYNARRSTAADGYETTFAVNHLGYFLLTNLLLDVLKASAPSRIVNVSSVVHERAAIDFADLNGERRYGGMRAYAQSKLANVLFTYELARRLDGSGVTVNCLHPGVVMSGFGMNNTGIVHVAFILFHALGRPFLLSPARGAETPVYLASSPEVEGVTGKYFVRKRAVPSGAVTHDEEIARRLWDVSEAMTADSAASDLT